MHIVRNWMRSPAIVAPATMVLPAARQLMQERRIRRLPVVDAAEQLVGIVTEGDINRVSDSPATDLRIYNLHHRISDLPIQEIMTRTVVTATPDTSIMRVARLLLKHRIGGVPVVEAGQAIGMITESDLFRLVVAHEREDAHHSATLMIR